MIIAWFMLGVIMILIFGFITAQSASNIEFIQFQFDRLTCPMPSSTGLWNSSNTLIYDNGTYNYPDVNNQTLTLTCTEVHTLDGVDYYFGQPTVAIGVFFFAGDYISETFNKLGAFFTILGTYLSPINFTIFNTQLEDMPTVAQAFIILVYLFAYTGIGVGIYKIVNPFGGA
jgi:hypothetical protein